MGFAHLHCYTYATPGDGWLHPRELCGIGRRRDVYAVALTDRGSLWKVPEYVQAANELDVEPIIGCEVRRSHNMGWRRKATNKCYWSKTSAGT